MPDMPDAPRIPQRDIREATYFHGRGKMWKDFTRQLDGARLTDGGTAFLVHGPPGAGKTALLLEFGERARSSLGWVTATIDARSLFDPATLALKLGRAAYADRASRSTQRATSGDVNLKVVVIRRKRGAATNREYSGNGGDALLRSPVDGSGLLLLLNEVQGLQIEFGDQKRRSAIKHAPESIQVGGPDGPVVLLAGGLSYASAVLAMSGVSRYGRGCLHNIGCLDPPDERAVIRDWRVKSGQVHDVEPYILNRWTATIAAEAGGWPQHVQCFAPPAAQWLLDHRGNMPEGVSSGIMAEGRAEKTSYYAQRVATIDRSYCCAHARMARNTPKGLGLEKSDVLDEFECVTRPESRHPGDLAEEVFTDVLATGVLPRDRAGLYRIPIPSMYRWLQGIYGERSHSRGSPNSSGPTEHRPIGRATIGTNNRNVEAGKPNTFRRGYGFEH